MYTLQTHATVLSLPSTPYVFVARTLYLYQVRDYSFDRFRFDTALGVCVALDILLYYITLYNDRQLIKRFFPPRTDSLLSLRIRDVNSTQAYSLKLGTSKMKISERIFLPYSKANRAGLGIVEIHIVPTRVSFVK